jgi:diguanylate cyclase (GGDEF)-like protein/PAS domain S-box-containing protein
MKVLGYSTSPEFQDRLRSLSSLQNAELSLREEYGAALEDFQPDAHRLVIIEAENPDADGISLCRKIRATASKNQCVVVMMTADDDPVLHRRALQAGADDVVDRLSDDDQLDIRIGSAWRRANRLDTNARARRATLSIQKAMDRMQLGVTITDLEGRILYVNEAEATMHGYSPEELLGESVRTFSPSDSWSQMEPTSARSMKSWRRESVNVRKDGSRFTVQLLSDVVLDGEGKPVAVVTVSEDITERKRMEAELGSTHDELTSRVKERTTELLEANIRLQHEILERRKVERQLLYEALHDSLTDLPNRALFFDRLSRVIAGSGRHPEHLFAVFYLDLDQYKVITESLGHDAGDRLLVQVAHRLRNSIRPEDTIGCAGGDEFLVLVEDLKDANDVTRVARRIQEALAAPMEIAGQTVFVTASIGIAMSSTGYERPEDMIRDSQIAMFRAQSGSGGGHVIFDREMHDLAVSRMKLEMELRQALDREEFNVHYQPIVELANGQIEGFEALARWFTDGDAVPPYEFITLAEEIGTIYDLEQQILHRVCHDIKQWRETFGDTSPYVSVNLSGKELSNPKFPQQVERILSEHDVDPAWLRFEVTESSIVENAEVASDVLADLKDLGIRVYVDDFGTGYSSLSSLHSFPIDTLKIDQSFISGDAEESGGWEIVRVIIGLARALGLEVIAEGIETSEQLDAIRNLGCNYGQGYLFSRPVPPTEAERFLGGETFEVA